MTYEIDGRILVIRQGDETDPEVIRRNIRVALQDPGLSPQSVLLWDATDAPARASSGKMQELLQGWSPSNKLTPRCAFLVTEALQYGASRMFKVYAEDFGVAVDVFYDIDQAKAWLLDASS